MSDRQDQLVGFSTETLLRSTVLVIGAGGLGGEIATGLSRKGFGRLIICDHDVVERSNLARQRFFAEDLYQSKALCLARNSARESCLGTECIGHAVQFDETTASTLSDGVDVAVVGVDNNRTRAVASCYFREHGLPVVFTAVNEASDFGWVFVQDVAGPCLNCIFPFIAESRYQREPCRDSPAALGILRLVSGAVLYAVGSLLMPQRRQWNYRDFNLVGDSPDCQDWASTRTGCPMCGGGHDSE